ncbi:hypothetical protein BE221DRAFT_194820 [Ostreococcus tauri]|uniref:Pre-mRNA-processing factor 17 n=1 Tax=Ostreococcus tauri TaxID=70448 RepID=A0A1Y5I8A2_OSTTA|nr:hypothetical protein BE221DRAFT_194820 [Ostreococcus tauri]
MLGVENYGSDASEDERDEDDAPRVTRARAVSAAPRVDSAALALERDDDGDERLVPLASTREAIGACGRDGNDATHDARVRGRSRRATRGEIDGIDDDCETRADPTERNMTRNLTYDEMTAPIEGPLHEYREDRLTGRGARNHALGQVDVTSVSAYSFEEQYNTYNSRGYARAVNGKGAVGDVEAYEANKGETAFTVSASKKRRIRDEVLASAATPSAGGDVDRSAWAPARAAQKVIVHDDLSEKEKEYLKWHMENREAKLRAKGKLEDLGTKPGETLGATDDSKTSTFHGKEEVNYAGQSWITAPKSEKRDGDGTCYAPNKCVHTFNGHTKGVAKIEFFPHTGHLLLSAGMDNVVKIWDVYNTRKCMRTYMGHDKAVKDVCFNQDGTRFVSTSWDKKVRLWDTETGKIIQTVSSGKIGYCAKIHPKQENLVLIGQSDKKIVQWDMNNGDLVQEYDQHLGPVNSITFADGGERFMSSSDDKSLRVWEFGIPVTTKYIADPSMHSTPATAISNSGKYIIGQSLDNQIVTYSVDERFRRNNKKRFGGHHNAGYACQPAFSTDDGTVVSGDGNGKLFFWDWKTSKIIKTIKAHDQVAIGVAWHPLKSSLVASCSWDKTIKLWK